MPRNTQPTAPATVFIVDEDDDTRRSLVNLFRVSEIVPRSYRSGTELLDTADLGVPGCLLLEIHPGEGGWFDLQERLAERACLLPIVFMSWEATVPIAVEAMKRGASDFLTKPFEDSIVLGAVVDAIRQNQIERARAVERANTWELIGTLTPREREVMKYVARGDLNKHIAHYLDVSEMMVKIHRSRMMRKLRVSSVVELIKKLDLVYGKVHPCELTETGT